MHVTIVNNLLPGFESVISYVGLGFVVPHTIYPAGYHCDHKESLPFVGIASQKASINIYHMGIYSNPEILEWFINKYPKYSKRKSDMGKSCIRFKKLHDIPYELIGNLMKKITVNEWIALYESQLKK